MLNRTDSLLIESEDCQNVDGFPFAPTDVTKAVCISVVASNTGREFSFKTHVTVKDFVTDFEERYRYRCR